MKLKAAGIRNVFPLVFGSLAVGAGVMFMLDPVRGHRRRILMRDKIFHYARVIRHQAAKKTRHLRNRTHGIVAETRSEIHKHAA